MTEFLDICHDAIKLQSTGIPKTLQSIPQGNVELIRDKRLVVFVGCGDSYAVAEYGKYALLSVHVNAVSLSPPELKQIALDEHTLVIGITASGRSIATIDSLKHANNEGAVTAVLTDDRDGSASGFVDHIWFTHSGVGSYNISPSVPTTSAMAYLLKIASLEQLMPHSRLNEDAHSLENNGELLVEWADKVGKEISLIIDLQKPLYIVSEGANFVAAQIGMMKFNEYSLVKGFAALREDFQHHYNLSIKDGDCVVFISDIPVIKDDNEYVKILTNTLKMQTYHLYTPETLQLLSPFGQAIANSIALQMAAYHTTLRYNPKMSEFKQPNADAFKIY
ncbi:MAG: SIS domain-containing protein [Candidatus Thorarchaeota archaeon]